MPGKDGLGMGSSAAVAASREIRRTDASVLPRVETYRHAVVGLGCFIAYVLLSRSEFLLETNLGFTVWYPPLGLAFAAMLSVTPWYATVIVLGDCVSAILFYHQSPSSWSVLVSPVCIALTYAAAAALLRGPRRIDVRLCRRRDVMLYVGVALSASFLATAFGVAGLWADHTITRVQFWGAAVRWYSGDAIALLGVGPFFLIYVSPWISRYLAGNAVHQIPERGRRNSLSANPRQIMELLAQGLSIPLVLWAMFAKMLAPVQPYPLSLLPIIWMGMRHGIKRASAGILALTFGIVCAINLFRVDTSSLPKFGALMLIVSFTGLLVGSAASERQGMARELEQQASYLKSLIENSPVGIVVLSRDGHVETCNAAFETLFGFGPEELNRQCPGSVIVSDSECSPIRQVSLEVFNGRSVRQTVHYTRSDRVEFDLELNAVPLLRDGQVGAAYLIYKDITKRVKAEKATRLQAESLKNWVKELQRRNLEMTLLSEMGNLLLCCANAEEANQVVDRLARRLFPDAVSGVFYQLKSCRNMLEATASWGEPVSKSSFLVDSCWALRRGQPYWSAETAIPCSHTDSKAGTHDLCVPMMAQGEALGILYLCFPQPAALATPAAVEELRQSRQGLATAVAGQIALSLANLKLRDSLRDQSIRDPLTGLFNRRFMQESLDCELQRAARRQRPLSILFLDLDHFKRFNDNFGHEAGDLVLSSVADCFRRNFRGDDIICRFGGEEFAIILPEASTNDAAKRADAFRLQVSSLKLRLHDRPLDDVTISIGVATFPDHGANVETLLQHADRGLYESKASGRNRVTVAKMETVAPLAYRTAAE